MALERCDHRHSAVDLLRLLINILLKIRNKGLSKGMPNGLNLRCVIATLNTDAHVRSDELLQVQLPHRFKTLPPQNLGLHSAQPPARLQCLTRKLAYCAVSRHHSPSLAYANQLRTLEARGNGSEILHGLNVCKPLTSNRLFRPSSHRTYLALPQFSVYVEERKKTYDNCTPGGSCPCTA